MIPEFEFPPITQEQLKEYSVASGDPNLIHLDESVAKKMGLPGVIAHGMLSAALIGERARKHARDSGWLSQGWKLKSLRTRFKAMTFLGESLRVGGQIKSQDENRIVMDLEAKNGAGEIKTTGQLVWLKGI